MTSLRVLNLSDCRLRAVPAFVGELESLTKLDLGSNWELGDDNEAPRNEAFPANLRKLTSLRDFRLDYCGLRAVPAFVGKLKELEELDLFGNMEEIYSTIDFLIEGCPCLREVLGGRDGRRRS
jgi:Leucine-rich repeat (LRR) protein